MLPELVRQSQRLNENLEKLIEARKEDREKRRHVPRWFPACTTRLKFVPVLPLEVGRNDLRAGQKVTFDIGEGPKGPRAENVKPAD